MEESCIQIFTLSNSHFALEVSLEVHLHINSPIYLHFETLLKIKIIKTKDYKT